MSFRSLKALLYVAFASTIMTGCIKEYSIEGQASNHVPQAKAGNDTIINSSWNIPGSIESYSSKCIAGKDTIQLNASLSSDPDGDIVSYQWSFLSDHPSNTGINPILLKDNLASISVILEFPGEYWFGLTVTDNSGATALDSIKVSNQSGYSSELLKPGYMGILEESNVMNIVAAGNKIFVQYQVDIPYGNGYSLSADRIKTFDFDTNTWSDLPLLTDRVSLNMACVGNKVLFCGGEVINAPFGESYYQKMDIFDIATGQWDVIDFPADFFPVTSYTVNNKIIFSGAYYKQGSTETSNQIEIFDLDNKTWTHTRMSQKRNSPSIVVADIEIIFAGGIFDQSASPKIVDIYNLQTNSWRVSSIQSTSPNLKGVAFGNKIYWVDIRNNPPKNNPIEVWNINTGNSEFICFGDGLNNIYEFNHQLLVSRNMSRIINNTINFLNIELYKYDPLQNKWTIGRLTDDGNPIGGIGAIIGQPGQQRIIGVGKKEYPNVYWDVVFLFPQFDHEFWEITF